MKKLIIAAAVLALAASSLSAVPANAAAVSAAKAVVLSECKTVGEVAKGKGSDGSDLKCVKSVAGPTKGKKIWQYPTLPVLSRLEMVVPNSATSGFGGFGKAVTDALKAEGLVKAEPVLTYKPGAGNTTGLIYMIKDLKGKAGKIGVTGFAQVGGAFNTLNKVTYRVSDATPIARMMGEYETIAVKADSKYMTIEQLVADLKKDPKSMAIVGGTVGGIDTYTAATLFDAIGLQTKDMNYTANNGAVAASILSDAKYAFGISGYGDFEQYVKAGSLRVLAVTSPLPVANINAPTLKSKKINVVIENWRGLILPPSTSAAGKTAVVRALDIVINSASFKAYLKSQSAFSLFMPEKKFTPWLKVEEAKIQKLYSDLGL